MELNMEQKAIVTTNEKKVVVIASAATGKTRILTERVKFLIASGVSPEDIAMITFTNAAAYEMKKRIGKDSEKMFIGTVHSLANRFLTNAGIKTGKIIDDENFDLLFKLVSENLSCIKSFKHLLLDEAQDSSEIQFKFILDMIKPENYMFVGDPKQSIYGFSGGRVDIFENLQNEAAVYYLNNNYRNSEDILNYAKSLIEYDYTDDSVAMSEDNGIVTKIPFSVEKIAQLIKYSDCPFKDWFILTRTNATLDYILNCLKEYNIPCDTFKKANLSSDDLAKKMQENTVKVLTVHTSKGLENENVIVVGVVPYNSDERKVAYVAATRAKKNLYWCRKENKRQKKIVKW